MSGVPIPPLNISSSSGAVTDATGRSGNIDSNFKTGDVILNGSKNDFFNTALVVLAVYSLYKFVTKKKK